MSTEERDNLRYEIQTDIHGEIRGITASALKTFIACTFALCSCIVGGIVYLKTTLVLHDYKIDGIERRDDKQDEAIQKNTQDILLLTIKQKE